MHFYLRLFLCICFGTLTATFTNAMDGDIEMGRTGRTDQDRAPLMLAAMAAGSDPSDFPAREQRELAAFQAKFAHDYNPHEALSTALASQYPAIRSFNNVTPFIEKVAGSGEINQYRFTSGLTPLMIGVLSLAYARGTDEQDPTYQNIEKNINHLLENGADASVAFDFFDANSALFRSEDGGNIKKLLENLHQTSFYNSSAITSIDVATAHNQPRILEILKNKQPYLDTKLFSQTLYTAITLSNADAAKKLIELGANPEERLQGFATIQDYALSTRDVTLIRAMGINDTVLARIKSRIKVGASDPLTVTRTLAGGAACLIFTTVLGSLSFGIITALTMPNQDFNSTNG